MSERRLQYLITLTPFYCELGEAVLGKQVRCCIGMSMIASWQLQASLRDHIYRRGSGITGYTNGHAPFRVTGALAMPTQKSGSFPVAAPTGKRRSGETI